MVPKENHRERVLTQDEEERYIKAAAAIGAGIEEAYQSALEGIRATQRGEQPTKPRDSFLLRDVFTILIDCALRPDECFRLRWDQVRDGSLHVLHGKTENARRVIPLPEQAASVIERRRQGEPSSPWVFPAPTRSGHIEKSSLKKQHARAVKLVGAAPFVLYECRHTCLTRWAEHMDPYTLAYLAGHSDFAMTKRYVHPQQETVRKAMAKVRGGHTSEHTTSKTASGE
jgi:integrase